MAPSYDLSGAAALGGAGGDVARLGARGAGLELGEIGFAVGHALEAGEAVADRVELADQNPLRRAVAVGRPIGVDDDHLAVALQRGAQIPEELGGAGDLVIPIGRASGWGSV